MGTRGAFGVRIGGVDKVTYNHSDSYPEGLGKGVVEDIVKMTAEGFDVKAAAERLRLVKQGDKPTPEDIERLKPFLNTDVSSGQPDEWYCLLRELQGELAATLKAGVMIDSSAFLLDSLFCEYAYILNLDSGMLEFYKGFQSQPHALGRYAAGDAEERAAMKKRGGEEYFGVALKQELPIESIAKANSYGIDNIVKAWNAIDAEEEESEESVTT